MKTLWIDNIRPEAPAIELIPDSAVVSRGNPFFVPDEDMDWCAVPTLGVVIDRLGMKIAAKFAGRYYNKLIVVSHQRRHDAHTPLEWMRDGALIAGNAFEFDDRTISLQVDSPRESLTVDLDAETLRAHFDAAIAMASELITLKSGDIIALSPESLLLPWPTAHVMTHPQNLIVSANGAQMLKVKFR
jgi:hypothetical protein